MLSFFTLVMSLSVDDASSNIMLSMVNGLRAANGLSPLSLSPELCSAASQYSQVQADRDEMGHSVDGTDFGKRIENQGYNGFPTAENVGEGYNSIQDVVNGWLGDEGHRANILSSSSNQIGIGYAKSSSGRLYWTQDFGKGNGTPELHNESKSQPKSKSDTKQESTHQDSDQQNASPTQNSSYEVKPTQPTPSSTENAANTAATVTAAPTCDDLQYSESTETPEEYVYSSSSTISSSIILTALILLY
eukprot:NODE_172_length_14331_cov_0.709177.p10 type:complete len:247 gc:universal NODE_172_length_14331_cov_0.709177:10508-9768(-)